MSRTLLCGHILQIKQSGLINNSFKYIKQRANYNKHWKNVTGQICCRQYSNKTENKEVCITDTYVPFTELVKFRKTEANRSIIVQVQSAHSFKELHVYCNQIGSVNHMFHYTSGVEPLHFILVEFATENDAKNVLSESCHVDDHQAVPVKSPFLWFKIGNQRKSSPKTLNNAKLDIENGNYVPTSDTIRDLVKNTENISDQMRVLHELTKLNDLGIRLRFLTARQIELALTGMFPEAVAYPFGSSINGYGKLGCDLDLILKLNGSNMVSTNSRLVYQCKAGLGNERSQSQRHMEAIGDLLHLFLPGCSQVRRILQARVPILKYNQQFTDIECDLSMANMAALHMSELLYLFGSIDDRVRPLIFTVRKWAQEVGLTNSSPGRWITNFSLTLLVLAFLQRTPVPVLPSINTLIKLADIKSVNFTDEYKIGAFLQDITKLDGISKNTDTLESLLLQFFEYYSNLDFSSKALSLNEAALIVKPEHSPLYIVNPLERGLNVSKNVSIEELERLKIELRNAAWILESQDAAIDKKGIFALFTNNNKNRGFFAQSARQNRMMEVKNLFEDEQENGTSDETIQYKNDQVKKEVENIKKETETRIQEIANGNGKVKEPTKRRSARRR